LAGNDAVTVCVPPQLVALLQNVVVKLVPVLGVIVPVHWLALSAVNVKLCEPPVLPRFAVVGDNGEAGPNSTGALPLVVVPQPAPLNEVAVACRWPGVELADTVPVT